MVASKSRWRPTLIERELGFFFLSGGAPPRFWRRPFLCFCGDFRIKFGSFATTFLLRFVELQTTEEREVADDHFGDPQVPRFAPELKWIMDAGVVLTG